VKHSACMQIVSDLVDTNTLTVTNLSTNARLWSALRGERPSFYGLNMGLCLPFAVGLALAFPKRRVLALDGDGSLIIETSALITAAEVSPPNLLAIVFDNGNYTDMGLTPTSRRTDLAKMAEGAGIERVQTVRKVDDFRNAVKAGLSGTGFNFLVAKVEKDDKPPFVGNYLTRSERGMKESFVDALRRLPDYPVQPKKNTHYDD
jgi:thiamine pyrophosphate-dependent acetolactate synthase large subunit-like protein